MDPVTLALAVALGALAVYALARPAPAAPLASPRATATASEPTAPATVRSGAPVTGPVYPTAIPAFGAQAPAAAPPDWVYGVQAGLAAGQALPGLVRDVRGIADALGSAAFGASPSPYAVPGFDGESLL